MTKYKTINMACIRLGLPMLLALFAASSFAKTVEVADGLVLPVYEDVTGDFQFAHGFGLIYGAMPVIEQLGGVEKMFPNATVTWRDIFTTAQQRDAMLSGALDFGSCTAGPYLIGWDRGVDWKVLQITGGWDAYLMVKPGGPEKIEDFIGTKMKMSPGPGTSQYFAVQEYLAQHGIDPKALDSNWVNLPHPAAMQAEVADQLTGHYTHSNYALAELAKGWNKIASFSGVYGGMVSVGACTMASTMRDHPQVASGYAKALRKVTAWMKTHSAAAGKAMSEWADGAASPEQFAKWLQSPIFELKTKNGNIRAVAESLHDLGVISKVPDSAADIYVYPDMAGSKW